MVDEALNDADSNVASCLPQHEHVPEPVSLILESRCFEKSPALRNLLLFLWQRRHRAISEYELAVEALGRSSLFDPKVDATVRVQISRLRQRLERFYQTEGQSLTQRLVIPLGSHQVQLIAALHAIPIAEPAVEPFPLPLAPQRNRRVVWLLMGICVVLLIAVTLLSLRLAYLRKPADPVQAQVAGAFWLRFFRNTRPTRIVLPTPIFFAYHFRTNSPNGNIMIRDTDVNSFNQGSTSEALRELKGTLGPAELGQNYTVTSDTFASLHLARYLDRSGLDTTVVSSADDPLAALDRENAIALGTWGTLTPLKPYLDRMDFALTSHERFAENPHALPGEPMRVATTYLSHTRAVWPGVIALLPSHSAQTHLLILTSRHTSALVSFLTSTNTLEELERMWKAKGSPDFYEVIVMSEMEGDSVVRLWPVALHPFKHST